MSVLQSSPDSSNLSFLAILSEWVSSLLKHWLFYLLMQQTFKLKSVKCFSPHPITCGPNHSRNSTALNLHFEQKWKKFNIFVWIERERKLCFCLSVCLSVCLSTYLSVRLSVCFLGTCVIFKNFVFVCLSVYEFESAIMLILWRPLKAPPANPRT